MFSMLNLFQMPVHMVYMGMTQRLSYQYDLNPAIMTDGLLWFSDLSSPDPTGILPVLGGTVSLLNMLTTSTLNTNSVMRKMRRYMFLFPLVTVPIWMTFPAVSINYNRSNFFLFRLSICIGSQLMWRNC